MTQHCKHCDRDLPLSYFHVDRSKRSGLTSKCKDCQRQYTRQRLGRVKFSETLAEEDFGQWVDRRRHEERYDNDH